MADGLTTSELQDHIEIPKKTLNLEKVLEASKWSYRFCHNVDKFTTPIVLFTQILKQLQPAASIFVFGYLISSLTKLVIDGGKDITSIYLPFLTYAIFNLTTTLINYFADNYSAKSKFTSELEIKSQFIKKFLEGNTENFIKLFGTDDVRVTFDKAPLVYRQFQLFISAIANTVTALSVALILGYYAPILPLLIIPLAIPHLMLEKKYRSANTKQVEESRKFISQVKRANTIYLDAKAVKTFSLMGLGDTVDSGYKDVMKQYYREANKVRYKWATSQKILTVANSIVTISAYAYVLLQTRSLLNVGSIYIQLMFVNLLRDRINLVISDYFASADNSEPILKIKDYLTSDGVQDNKSVIGKSAEVSITLENVSFSSDGKENLLLPTNLQFKEGSNNAFISNPPLIRLIGFIIYSLIKPTNGRVLMNNMNIEEIDKKSFASKLLYISGPGALFDFLPLKEFFSMGDGLPFDESRAKKFAAITGADKILEKFSVDWEGKTKSLINVPLSSFEVGLILVTKALYQQNKFIMFYMHNFKFKKEDERLLTELLFKYKENSTVLIFSQMLTTNFRADQIILTDKNSVLEKGTYSQLMDKGGQYAGLYNKATGNLPGEVESQNPMVNTTANTSNQ